MTLELAREVAGLVGELDGVLVVPRGELGRWVGDFGLGFGPHSLAWHGRFRRSDPCARLVRRPSSSAMRLPMASFEAE